MSKRLKKFCIVLIPIIIALQSNFIRISAQNTEMSGNLIWNLNVGDVIIWSVTQSNTTYGFLPKDSQFELEITSLEIWETGGGKQASQINATFSYYNSSSSSTNFILNNSMFLFFNASLNETLLFNPVFDIGIFIPISFQKDFFEGLNDYYIDLNIFDIGFPIIFENKIEKIHFINITNQIDVDWKFNDQFISDKLKIKKDGEIIYELTLISNNRGRDKDGNRNDEISTNLFVIIVIIISSFIGTTFIFIYILRKKGKLRRNVKIDENLRKNNDSKKIEFV